MLARHCILVLTVNILIYVYIYWLLIGFTFKLFKKCLFFFCKYFKYLRTHRPYLDFKNTVRVSLVLITMVILFKTVHILFFTNSHASLCIIIVLWGGGGYFVIYLLLRYTLSLIIINHLTGYNTHTRAHTTIPRWCREISYFMTKTC